MQGLWRGLHCCRVCYADPPLSEVCVCAWLREWRVSVLILYLMGSDNYLAIETVRLPLILFDLSSWLKWGSILNYIPLTFIYILTGQLLSRPLWFFPPILWGRWTGESIISKRGLNQIWLQVREESRKKTCNPSSLPTFYNIFCLNKSDDFHLAIHLVCQRSRTFFVWVNLTISTLQSI